METKNKKSAYESASDNEDEEMDSPTEIKATQKKSKTTGRQSVSAEAFGTFNKKQEFKPVVIPKSQDATNKISKRLETAFMFSNLTQQEVKIVVDAMQVKKYNKGDKVIGQGDDGDELYVVDEGELDCYKRFGQDEKDTHLKVYNVGDSFGELALLYNAPRAATILVKSSSAVLCILDRNTFNYIVKDAAAKKRDQYEAFLKKVEILKEMDDYERLQVADCLKPLNFKAGEVICKEGETGSAFFILEVGNCKATKTIDGTEKEIKQYKSGDYFGELALLRDDCTRQANILASDDVTVCSIDQRSFKRLLGSLEDILKRNSEQYEKFMKA